MKSRTAVLFIVFALLFAAQASAQSLGLGIHGASAKSATEDERAWQWGAHARARLGAFLGIEGSLDFREEELADGSKVTLYPIQFSALVYVLPHSTGGLYGLIGLGWTRVAYDGSFFGEDVENNELGYHWGFGGELPLSGGATIFADIRYLNLDMNISKLIRADLDTAGWQFNFGFTYYF